ncbi:hypothetical protein LZ023_13670 [Pseudomonas silvicola]|nr:hypothetical protein LZ023_13670 [Pseudomonas silvicola]
MNQLEGKSFVASVSIATPMFAGPVVVSEYDNLLGSGWLMAGEKGALPVSLQFDYQQHGEDRIMYRIKAGPDAGKRAGDTLGLSRNDYLGLYREAEVTEGWKMELIDYNEAAGQLRFFLRDHEGHRVAVPLRVCTPYPKFDSPVQCRQERFLIAGKREGTVLEFTATIENFL